MYNAIYKTITKAIANKLKPILPSFISLEQLGFVEGHQIMYGIILVHEVIHSIKIKKIPRMMVKLDIEKACNKLNWKFMREMLKTFHFRYN